MVYEIRTYDTKEDFYKLVEMIYGFCGFVVEFVEVIR